MFNAATKRVIREWVPPRLIRMGQTVASYISAPEWEYVSTGWPTQVAVRGWNVHSVAEFQKARWRKYAEALSGHSPLAVNHEEPQDIISGKLRDHNTLMSYAYVLTLAAHQKTALSILDWGGGVGHYSLLSKAVLPEVALDYHCHDVPVLCSAGRELTSAVHFIDSPAECFRGKYDLVLASSSLWYEERWQQVIDRLIDVASPYLYVTRMIFVERSSPYVAIQRTSADSYQTEYLCWILNRDDFVKYVCARGMRLVREFIICDAQHIVGAPEQGSYQGFLFCNSAAKNRQPMQNESVSGVQEVYQ